MTELQYITDAKGQKTGVILPIEEYEEMFARMHSGIDEVDDPELLAAMREVSDSPEVSREQIFKILEREP